MVTKQSWGGKTLTMGHLLWWNDDVSGMKKEPGENTGTQEHFYFKESKTQMALVFQLGH